LKTKFGRSDFSTGVPYFALMIFFAVVCIIFAVTLKESVLYYLAGAQLAAALVCFFAVLLSSRLYKRKIMRTMHSIDRYLSLESKDTLSRYPMPVVVHIPETEEVLWYNKRFAQLLGPQVAYQHTKITELVEGFSSRWLIEGKNQATGFTRCADRRYYVFGSMMNSNSNGKVAVTFWVDVTELANTSNEYAMSRPNVAILRLDNYSELVANLSDTDRSGLSTAIDDKVKKWAAFTDGLLFKTDREKYMFIFEERYLEKLTDRKFSVLDDVRSITSAENVPASLSIGVGHGGDSFKENHQLATQSMDMAMSRGGDQAVVRDRNNFGFYGGRAKEVEKQSKVKVRVQANALGELLSDTTKVFVMGHKNADIDSLGAAAGVCAIARKRGIPSFIVMDMEHNDAKPLIARLRTREEYANKFLSAQDALMMADARSLLVVVDTNRPAQVESGQLLMSFNRIAVIDHHRRAPDYIERTIFNFLEPSASSASEMTVHLMQYLVSAQELLKVEADALLAGMVLDTKSFSVRTGGRTFEAAAFVKKAGADTVEVKRLFQSDVADTVERYDIVRSARMYNDDIAVSVVDHTTDRALAAKAADELLSIAGINASFVLYPDGDSVVISARSIGEINVQVILEALGGGGNMATAGAQMKDCTVQQALRQLVASIDKYFETV